VVAFVSCVTFAGASDEPIIRAIPPPKSFLYAAPKGINNRGEVVGELRPVDVGELSGAFHFKNGRSIEITGGSLRVESAMGINDTGVIAASGRPPDDLPQAIKWERGKAEYLGILFRREDEWADSTAMAINNNGDVAGISFGANEYRACLWRKGRIIDLGDLGGNHSEAHAINDNGQVVGASYDHKLISIAFLWENGKMRRLNEHGKFGSDARAINRHGDIVGFREIDEDTARAVLWKREKVVELGVLGGDQSIADGINDNGVIVGRSEVPSRMWHAFVWRDGKMTDLNDSLPPASGWELDEANAINNRDEVIGFGKYKGNPTGYIMRLRSDMGQWRADSVQI